MVQAAAQKSLALASDGKLGEFAVSGASRPREWLNADLLYTAWLYHVWLHQGKIRARKWATRVRMCSNSQLTSYSSRTFALSGMRRLKVLLAHLDSPLPASWPGARIRAMGCGSSVQRDPDPAAHPKDSAQ